MPSTGGGRPKVTYLQINSNGKLYFSVKEDSPLASQATEIKTKDNTYLHMEFDKSVSGRITDFRIREVDYKNGKPKVKVLSIGITGKDVANPDSKLETDSISIPLFRPGTEKLHNYIKSLVCVIPSIDFDRPVIFSPDKRRNDNGYIRQNVFINYGDVSRDQDNKIPLAHKFGKNGDVPPAEKKEGITGENITCTEKQDGFLYRILKEQIERYKTYSEGCNGGSAYNEVIGADSNPSQSTIPTGTAANTPTSEGDENPLNQNLESNQDYPLDDDLPF